MQYKSDHILLPDFSVCELFDSSIGDDPLAEGRCDMDSVAGVLKLYFRGLEKALFPEESYEQLMECGRKTILQD